MKPRSRAVGTQKSRVMCRACVSGASTSYETLKPLGAVRRSAPERAAAVAWGGAGGRLLAVQSAGRAVELFRCRHLYGMVHDAWAGFEQELFCWWCGCAGHALRLVQANLLAAFTKCCTVCLQWLIAATISASGGLSRQIHSRLRCSRSSLMLSASPVFRVRSEAEARKHMKRRRKRRREKAAKAGEASAVTSAAEEAAAAAEDEVITAADELEPIQVSFPYPGER